MLAPFAPRRAARPPRTCRWPGSSAPLGMLAEASGCGAVLDVAASRGPAGASLADWLTCFPGFAMLTADDARRAAPRRRRRRAPPAAT